MGGPQNIFLEQQFVSANFFNGSIMSSPMKGKTQYSNAVVLRKYPVVEKTSGDNLVEKSNVAP